MYNSIAGGGRSSFINSRVRFTIFTRRTLIYDFIQLQEVQLVANEVLLGMLPSAWEDGRIPQAKTTPQKFGWCLDCSQSLQYAGSLGSIIFLFFSRTASQHLEDGSTFFTWKWVIWRYLTYDKICPLDICYVKSDFWSSGDVSNAGGDAYHVA